MVISADSALTISCDLLLLLVLAVDLAGFTETKNRYRPESRSHREVARRFLCCRILRSRYHSPCHDQLMKPVFSSILALTLLSAIFNAEAEIKITVDHNSNEKSSSSFKFKNVPSPSARDAANGKTFVIVDGERDENGGNVDKLTDGKAPQEEDQPAENFFFNAGTAGGRLGLDLEKEIEIKQINAYSWHPNTRGPQVYRLYAASAQANASKNWPRGDLDKAGWKLIAKVDTRDKSGENGGQYAVSISDSDGAIGKFRYLLFEVSRTEVDDDFGNTFYSEIDVFDSSTAKDPAASADSNESEGKKETVDIGDGKYKATVDTTDTPYLTSWVDANVIPMIKEWYPKLVDMLQSKDYQAPTEFSIVFVDGMRGVAATGGTRIRCSGSWFRSNLKGEALGAVFHEVVHVVQQYGAARRANPDAPRRARPPGWLTEGIPDYIRWYLFEPQLHGADITKRNFARAKYDGSYRITANFLNWSSQKYDKDLAVQLNAAIREGRYSEDLWKEFTGHTVEELDAEWRKDLEDKLGIQASTGTGGSVGGKN